MKSRSKKHFWQRWYRYFFLRLLRSRSNPSQRARGVAVGIFSGMFPFFGLQTLIAIALATIINGDKILAVLGTWITNPFTDIPIFWFNFQVGTWIYQRPGIMFHRPHSWEDFWQMGKEILVIWLTGCLLVGTIAALIGYCAVFWIAQKMSDRRKSA